VALAPAQGDRAGPILITREVGGSFLESTAMPGAALPVTPRTVIDSTGSVRVRRHHHGRIGKWETGGRLAGGGVY